MIHPALPADAEAIAAIYNHYILNSISTFEEQIISAQTMARRMAEVNAAALPWLVAEDAGRITGYAYASRWKTRSGYRFSVESSIYLDPSMVGGGLGTRLYQALLADVRQLGVHAVMGGVSLPNEASVRLHEKLGFLKVAHFKEVGYKFGGWIDVGYWQLIF